MTKGIHHITAIASNAQNNHAFYTDILGLRMVKKTVNQDDTTTYHLFYGDRLGHPGMDLTFFIFQPSQPGKRGNGLVTTISLNIPEDALSFWQNRFHEKHIKHEKITEVLGRKRIRFFDEDNQQLELVAATTDELEAHTDIWQTSAVSKEHAIRSFHSATLSVADIAPMDTVLTHVFGYEKISKEDNNYMYHISDSHRANMLHVVENKHDEFGLNAAGTVHHIAFRAKDTVEQLALTMKVMELGLAPTHVIDRFYFKSVYFRTPSGILFEIATDEPGFTADEKEEELGNKLSLPPFLEGERKWIEANLPPIPEHTV